MLSVERRIGDKTVRWWQETDGSYWITGEELGKQLGYKEGEERKSIHRLASRNAIQLAPFRSVVSLTTEAGTRETAIFEEHGAWILAMKARTPKAEEVQLHIAQLMTRFRRKEVIIMDRHEFEERERDRNKLISTLCRSIERSKAEFFEVASLAGKTLNHWKKVKSDNPMQSPLPFMEAKRVDVDEGPGGSHDQG